MHSVFSTCLYVVFARDLAVVIDSGLTTSDQVTADNLHVKFDSEKLCFALTELYKNLLQHHITVTYSKGPKWDHFGPLFEPGGGRPPEP